MSSSGGFSDDRYVAPWHSRGLFSMSPAATGIPCMAVWQPGGFELGVFSICAALGAVVSFLLCGFVRRVVVLSVAFGRQLTLFI
jgi:hypothetical protein